MAGVMPSMPGVVAEDGVEGHNAVFGMRQLSLEIGIGHRTKQTNPTIVQRFEQRERRRDRRVAAVRELRPSRLVIRPDRRILLRQRKLETRVRVEVTVWNMMDDLAGSPAAFAIGRVELSIVETGRCFAHTCRSGSDLIDEFAALG